VLQVPFSAASLYRPSPPCPPVPFPSPDTRHPCARLPRTCELRVSEHRHGGSTQSDRILAQQRWDEAGVSLVLPRQHSIILIPTFRKLKYFFSQLTKVESQLASLRAYIPSRFEISVLDRQCQPLFCSSPPTMLVVNASIARKQVVRCSSLPSKCVLLFSKTYPHVPKMYTPSSGSQ
jgi:hypothetical protein